MLQQQYCLRWKYHHSNLQTMFASLLDRGCFCDVTLACEEKMIRAHRVVLCACSVYFDSILTNHADERNPIIIMKDAKFNDIKILVDFMYRGEINVEHENLASLLKTAEELKIKGLAEVSWRNEKTGATNIDPLAPPVTAELFDSSSLSRNTSNIYVKTFNPASYSSAHSPNLLMYPKVHTPVSLAPAEQMSAQALSMSPFHPMVMMPQMHQQQQQQQPNIPQLTPLRIQGAATVAGEQPHVPAKKKRGRPPLDGEFEHYTAQMPVTPQHKDPLFSSPAEELICNNPPETTMTVEPDTPMENLTEDDPDHNFMDIVKIEQPDTPEVSDYNEYDSDHTRQMPKPKKRRSRQRDTDYVEEEEDNQSVQSEDKHSSSMMNTSVTLSAQEAAEWSDVVKMSDYLTNGRRPQFWEEPFTRRVLEAINSKSLEMKKAAVVLGVSYGTLYGRYREVYGCLKHPYRGPMPKGVQNYWSQVEQSPTELLNILQRTAMTMGGGGGGGGGSRTGRSSSSGGGGQDYQIDNQNLQQQLRSQGVTLISE